MLNELNELLAEARKLNRKASALGLKAPEGTDQRDHLMQAHFRLTEVVAHLAVARMGVDLNPHYTPIEGEDA